MHISDINIWNVNLSTISKTLICNEYDIFAKFSSRCNSNIIISSIIIIGSSGGSGLGFYAFHVSNVTA